MFTYQQAAVVGALTDETLLGRVFILVPSIRPQPRRHREGRSIDYCGCEGSAFKYK
ncbi:hypothetical protein ACT8ZS_16565 [Paenibacillus sp. M.A.Huq-84]